MLFLCQLNAAIWNLDRSGILSYCNHPAAIDDFSNWEADNRNCPARGTIVSNQANSGFSWAVLPHRLNYNSPTSPTALNDVMGSAVQRDERDKAEPAGTRQLPQHSLGTEKAMVRIQPLSPSLGEPRYCLLEKKRRGGRVGGGKRRDPC